QPYPPPLMNTLYAALSDFSREKWGLGSLFAAHSEALQHHFEDAFAKVVLGESDDDHAPRVMWPSLNILEAQSPIALYFSQFSVEASGLDCYSQLILGLKRAGRLSDCLFYTLNYDCLLEQAAVLMGLNVDYSCTQNEAIHMAKLHGSCNLITERISQH